MAMLAFSVSANASSVPPGRVLHIGDSQSVGTFGRTIYEGFLDTQGEGAVLSIASCGSTARHWLSGNATRCGYVQRGELTMTKAARDRRNRRRRRSHATPVFETLAQRFHPDIVVVQLGGNYMGRTERFLRETVDRLAQQVVDSGARCVWVGPSDARRDNAGGRGLSRDEVADLLPGILGDRCQFIDSRRYTSYPTNGGDGVHLDSLGSVGRRMARAWAEAVIAAVIPQADAGNTNETPSR